MKKLNYILPTELQNVLNSLEYEEEGGIIIKTIRYDKNCIELDLHVFCTSLDTPVQIWNITMPDIQTENINLGWANDLQFYSEHFLLTEYQDNYAELYFTGTSDKADQIFIDIYKLLTELGSTEEIARYVYSPKALALLCKQGYGFFARGPKSILNVYTEVLSKYNLKPRLMGEVQKNPADKNLKMLIIGESHFIATDFIFKKFN